MSADGASEKQMKKSEDEQLICMYKTKLIQLIKEFIAWIILADNYEDQTLTRPTV